MAGGNDKTKKLVRGCEGLSKLCGSPFSLLFTSVGFYLLHLLSPWRGVDREGLLVGHFDQLSSNNTIFRVTTTPHNMGLRDSLCQGPDSTHAQHC